MIYSTQNVQHTTSLLLIIASIAIIVLACMLMRKMSSHDHNKMLKAQSFALENPEKIETIKLVDRNEVYCVVKMHGASPEIIANGVEAVRVYDKLMLLNPTLG